MGQNSGFGVFALVRIQVKEGSRSVTDRLYKNLITNAGLAHLAGLFNSTTTGAARYVALGTGNLPADPADTTLEVEVTTGGGARKIGTLSRTTTTVLNDTARVVAQFDMTINISLTELGLLSELAAGVLVSHVTFSPVAVSSGQSVVITWSYAIDEV